MRREKRKYLDAICLENNPGKTWNTLKSFNIDSSRDYNIPEHLADPNDISDFFGEFLQNVSDCSTMVNYYNNRIFNNELNFSFRMVEIAEIHKVLQSIQTNAAGSDGITSRMVKYCSPFIDTYVTHIINCCIEVNYFPDQWKTSIGKPLPKTHSPATFNDIRIISILPILSKMFEKVLYSQLFHFCVSNGIIPDSQCGFRKDFSTSVALVGITDDIMRAIDRKLNTILVLLDFSKAFDTLHHDLLFAKLKYYGFSYPSLSLIKSYFSTDFKKSLVIIISQSKCRFSLAYLKVLSLVLSFLLSIPPIYLSL